MASYNRIIMVGNLTRDPDYKQLASGQTLCRLGLASNRQFKNRQTGTMVQEVCFVDIDVWGPQADSCNQYLQKGSAVLVEGRLKFDTWQDDSGQKRSKHFIVADRVTFLSSSQSAQDEQGFNSQQNNNSFSAKQEAAPANNGNANNQQSDSANGNSSSTGEVSFKDQAPFEDDLPF
jgi:single-strand DNA-binding protein